MNDIEFWEIIDQCRRACLGHGNKIPELLKEKLLKLDVTEVIEFDGILIEWLEKSYSNELWAVYAVATGWDNPERFDNFRVWLVAMGKDYLERVVETPEILLHEFSSYWAEYIGGRVKSLGNWIFNMYPYTGKTPKMAAWYSRRYKLIGNPVSNERYQELRDKHARLQYDALNGKWGEWQEGDWWDDSPRFDPQFVQDYIPIHQSLLENLRGRAKSRDLDVSTLINEILEKYLDENKGSS